MWVPLLVWDPQQFPGLNKASLSAGGKASVLARGCLKATVAVFWRSAEYFGILISFMCVCDEN